MTVTGSARDRQSALERCRARNVCVMVAGSEGYPRRLSEIPDPPGARLVPLQRQANLVGGDWYDADVAEHLRSRDPDLPALFVTGYGADILESRGIEADGGATTVLQKPFTRSELLAAVGTALEEVR